MKVPKNSTKPKKQKKSKRPKLPAAEEQQEEKEAIPEDSAPQQEEQSKHMDSDDGNGPAHESADNDDNEMDLGNFVPKKTPKKRKKGIIFISNIPKHMNVTRVREMLGEYGKIGRIYLQPEKLPGGDNPKKKKKRKRKARHFTEGWVEFESKRVAKQIVPLLNNKQISSRKKSQFFDSLWSMKYLPRFKWTHLTERMNYEQAVHKQRLMTEVSQARKETTFFQNNLDQSEHLKKKSKKMNKEAASAKGST